MSLRARILALFLGLGVIPILLLGAVGYARSMTAVRRLLEAQTSGVARRTAAEIENLYELRLSELLLLAENAETQRLYAARSGGSPMFVDSALEAASDYLSDAWSRFRGSYRRIDLLDLEGRPILSLGAGSASGVPPVAVAAEAPDLSLAARLLVPVLDLGSGEKTGTLVAMVPLRVILSDEALRSTFGRSGYTVVVDRRAGEVLYHPSRRYVHQPLSALLGPDAWDVDAGALTQELGSFVYQEVDSARVGSFVSLQDPPWTVISTASVEEFAPPFRGARRGDLLIVLFLAVVVGGAFLVTLRRTTASLEALTDASERVGSGDLDPPLPPPGPDEVGRLSSAFGLMVGQVREMLRRVEETRQMAVMGELASSVSHQIRNPLTSIKLNLQGLQEVAETEGMSDTATRSLRICLREVDHLEGAAQKILSLARTHPPRKEETSLHGLIDESIELLQSQLQAKGVRVMTSFRAADDRIPADPEELKSVFVNLLVNAEEAMPGGGTVRISTENGRDADSEDVIRIRVQDDGPGVPEDVREQIFRPFVTTKKDGTGFGLAVARQAVQEHGGRIRLERDGSPESTAGAAGDGSASASRRGASFMIDLPLHRAAAPLASVDLNRRKDQGACVTGSTGDRHDPTAHSRGG